MNEKAACSSSARFAISLLVFAIVWTLWFVITSDIIRSDIHSKRGTPVLVYIQLPLGAILSIAAAFFHEKRWLLKGIWLIPYATGMIATMSLALYGQQTFFGYSDDKTIVGLLLGIPILILAIVLAALAASVSSWIKRKRKQAAP
jgi:hypothetical protein